mmetsp:Transcript_94400/g.224839  ORF Transcript_94400/g.224839 Transcript_94400/m.224839 type:complete len:239 (-) Transcript_94400:232-948(-)
MGVGTAEALRATLLVVQAWVLLGPVRARLRPVAHARLPTRVLVVVGIDAGLPVMLHSDGTPQGLVLVHEEVFGEDLGHLHFLGLGQELRLRLLPSVGELAGCAAAALGHLGVGGAEADLPHRPVFLNLPPSVDQQPVGVALRCPGAQLLLLVRKAANLLATTAPAVAPPGFVLCGVVGDLVAGVREDAVLPVGARPRGHTLARHVPVPQAAEGVDGRAPALRVEVEAKAEGRLAAHSV